MYTETYEGIRPLLVETCHVGNVAQKSGEIVAEKDWHQKKDDHYHEDGKQSQQTVYSSPE